MSDVRPRLLDLFSGAGGAARGYQLAGFEVTGIDHNLQPRYAGERFVRADALQFLAEHGHEYDLIHASPPCQAYSRTNTKHRPNHPDLIGPTRLALQKIGKPYIIENVEDARDLLINPLMLCGQAFGLPIHRHRYFESSFPVRATWEDRLYCRGLKASVYITGSPHKHGKPIKEPNVQQRRIAMQISWMTQEELDDAIPPAFTLFLGNYYLQRATARIAAALPGFGADGAR